MSDRDAEDIATGARMIAGYRSELVRVPLVDGSIGVYAVADLERHVDRGALLRGESEPPYWAHLWTGARALASYVARWAPTAGLRALDLGCGLGLTGLVAARGGADVLFVDSVPAALEFVAASARANALPSRTRCADFRTLPSDAVFDVILAAEVAYDPPTFDDLAATIARHLAPGGRAFLADAYRTDTRPLYRALAAAGLATHGIDLRAAEDGRPVPLRLTAIRRRRD